MKVLMAYLVICCIFADLFTIAILKAQPKSWYQQVPAKIRIIFYIGVMILNIVTILLGYYAWR